MANRHYEHALQGLPCRVSSTALTIYQIICYRYDIKEFKDGKPNRGYLKSYPGMKALVKATGRTRQACNTAIESLIANGLITRITIGKPDSRAEYLPIFTLNALGESVKYPLHVSKVYKSRKLADNVKTTSTISKEDLPNESSSLDTISITSIPSTKSITSTNSYNLERFDFIIQGVPKEFRTYIKPGSNYEKRLDELEHKGKPLKAVQEYLGQQNWYSASSKGGLLNHFLEALLGVKKVGEPSSMPSWCGDDYCDPITREWPETSTGKDGKVTYQCLTCHPNQLRDRPPVAPVAPKLERLLNEFPLGRPVDDDNQGTR